MLRLARILIVGLAPLVTLVTLVTLATLGGCDDKNDKSTKTSKAGNPTSTPTPAPKDDRNLVKMPLPAAPDTSIEAFKERFPTPGPKTPSTTNGQPAKPTFRDNLIGEWQQSVFGGGRGEWMRFQKDGRFERYTVSIHHQGTFRVVDDTTIETNTSSVLSDYRTKTTLKVVYNDQHKLLTVTNVTPKMTFVKQGKKP